MTTVLIISGILALVVGFMTYAAIASHKWHRENTGEETVTETDHFYGHLFYYNAEDKRIFVQKRTGGGFTINFANPLSIIACILVISAFIALALLA